MASFQWKLNKKIQFKKKTVSIPALDHPLKNFSVIDRLPRKLSRSQTNNDSIDIVDHVKHSEILDPLTELALKDMDPLTRMQKEDIRDSSETVDEPCCTPTKLWDYRKTAILNKYTTSNKISLVSSYLVGGDKIIMKNQNAVVDKVQNRLEQLDCFEETSQRRMELSQAEYINRIDMLNKELVSAWNSEQRVKAVKIAIQCAKLLGDTDVMSFYPSKFVLITEILDIFGHFIYDRLKHMAETKPGTNKTVILPDNFTPDMIPDAVKETCLNWFYKIASIRELVPRLYVELAFIRSYNFISSTEAYDSLLRITKMINGIGNPLVAVYARCYLCKVALTLPYSTNNSYAFENLKCVIGTYHHFFNENMKEAMSKDGLTVNKYLDLFSPALDFIMEIITVNASDKVLDDVLSQCSKNGMSSLILNTILSVFKPNYVANKTVEFLELIGQSVENDYPVSILLCSLGNALSKCPPPSEQRKPILKNIGKYTDTFRNLDEYICYVEAWMPFIVKNFKIRETNAMLGDIIAHVSKRKDAENYVSQLKKIIRIVIENVDCETLFTSDNFLPFLDLFQQDAAKVEICKVILESCKVETKISDPIVASTFSFLCTILHDSVDALTPEDELRQIGQIICNIIRKIDFGRDFEQQLSFYVEARGSFSNIDSVLIELVQQTNTLMVKTRNIMQGFHSRKTADFTRACAAYCFITIPSISSSKARLELYLLSAQVAYFNQCLGQGDACLKAALGILQENQEIYCKDESFVISYVEKFLSVLLVTPDNPDAGVLSLFRSLLNILQRFEWDDNGVCGIRIYLDVLDVLSIMGQESLPYHIDRVESNDVLYGNGEKFVQEIDKICTIILREVLNKLKDLGNCRKQSSLMLDLFIRVLNRCDLNEPCVLKLAMNLWQQSVKNGNIEKKYMENIKKYYISRSIRTNNENLKRLIVNLS